MSIKLNNCNFCGRRPKVEVYHVPSNEIGGDGWPKSFYDEIGEVYCCGVSVDSVDEWNDVNSGQPVNSGAISKINDVDNDRARLSAALKILKTITNEDIRARESFVRTIKALSAWDSFLKIQKRTLFRDLGAEIYYNQGYGQKTEINTDDEKAAGDERARHPRAGQPGREGGQG